jgi:putative nucleotidyltransferase with HDIG domain
MSIEPSFEEQQLLEHTLRLRGRRMTRRELLAGVLSATGLFAAVAGLWATRTPHGFPVGPAIVCLAVLAMSVRVPFDTPLGFTVPTQLAFIPLVFALPPALVPIAVAIAFALAMLPDVKTGAVRLSRLLQAPANAWFSVGPVAVLAIADVQPRHAGPVLLLAALAAQFLVDFTVSTLRFAVARYATFSSQLRTTWVYAIDAALSGVGLVVAQETHATPLAVLALVPLLGLLAVFARERRRRLESMLELSTAYRGTALVLGDVVEADDGYTGEHCKSVVGLALELAQHLGLSAERRRNLEFGALLHDVGKIAIPKEIINKPGKLDPHEWTIIKTHAAEGQKLLERIGGFMREVGLIVRSHHERWDGGGYPDGLAGEAIPLEARIIAVCDAWNAMRTDRSYRKALTEDVALAELLSCSGAQFDPGIVDTFVARVVHHGGLDRAVTAPELAVTPGADGGRPPQPAYGYAPQAC